MTASMPTRTMTGGECLRLLARHAGSLTGSLSLDGKPPVPLVCFPQRDGTVLIPTGRDAELATAAVAQSSVRVSFDRLTTSEGQCWNVRGRAYAYPTGRRDRPAAGDTITALALSSMFEHGVRLTLDDLIGHQVDQP